MRRIRMLRRPAQRQGTVPEVRMAGTLLADRGRTR